MNRNPSDFAKFLAAARRGRPDTKPEAPFGFATRISARCFASSEDRLAPWEKFARWGAMTASVMAILFAVYGRKHMSSNPLVEMAREAEETEVFW